MLILKFHEEPNIDERECAKGFLIGTTVAYDINKDQHYFLLNQAMNFNTLV